MYFTESQNIRSCKGAVEVTLSKYPAQAGLPRVSCPGQLLNISKDVSVISGQPVLMLRHPHKKRVSWVSCFNPSWQLSPPQQFTHFPCWDEERVGRRKVRKLMGWGKDRLISKAKVTCTSRAKQGIHSFTSTYGWEVVQPSPGKQGSIIREGYLGRQML